MTCLVWRSTTCFGPFSLSRRPCAGGAHATCVRGSCNAGVFCAVPKDELQIVATAIAEHVEAAAQRVLIKNVLHQSHQPVELPAHIDWMAVRQDPRAGS